MRMPENTRAAVFHGMRGSPVGLDPRSLSLAWLLWSGLLCLGCGSTPAAIEVVDVDPAAASEGAIAAYDVNGDGQLDPSELAKVPGIAKYRAIYDRDGNGLVSEAEIRERLKSWADRGLGFRELIVSVLLDGRPLAGARVQLVPEAYLGEGVKPAEGETDASGTALVGIAAQDMPVQLKGRRLMGVTGGTYKILVTHDGKQIPARYNAETTLGEEIAYDTVGSGIALRLSSD